MTKTDAPNVLPGDQMDPWDSISFWCKVVLPDPLFMPDQMEMD